MSEIFKFHDPHGFYFVTSTVVQWIDIFTNLMMQNILLSSIEHCQQHKDLIVNAWCLMSNHLLMVVWHAEPN